MYFSKIYPMTSGLISSLSPLPSSLCQSYWENILNIFLNALFFIFYFTFILYLDIMGDKQTTV